MFNKRVSYFLLYKVDWMGPLSETREPAPGPAPNLHQAPVSNHGSSLRVM